MKKNTEYLKSYSHFFNHRHSYYKNYKEINSKDLNEKIFNRNFNQINYYERTKAISNLSKTKANIVITTATKNRKEKILEAYKALLNQKYTNWHWVIIDNNSKDNTMEEVKKWNDSRVEIVKYSEMTGCAYPVRNFAFDIVQSGFKNNYSTLNPLLINIDSDDRLYNEYSLQEMINLQKRALLKKGGYSLIHGYAVWETYDENFKPIISSCPADLDNFFPRVSKMYEIFEKGLIFLAAGVPLDLFNWLRYPAEFSFEDDAVSQKLMLYGISKYKEWEFTNYPIILKGFGEDTMINKNNNVGNTDKIEVIGINHKVTGVRAVIVSYLRILRDYYFQNNL